MSSTLRAPILPPSLLQSLARTLLDDLMMVEGQPAVAREVLSRRA